MVDHALEDALNMAWSASGILGLAEPDTSTLNFYYDVSGESANLANEQASDVKANRLVGATPSDQPSCEESQKRLRTTDLRAGAGKNLCGRTCAFNIAGRAFASYSEMISHLHAILNKPSCDKLGAEDAFFVLHLVLKGHKGFSLCSSAITGFRSCGPSCDNGDMCMDVVAELSNGSQMRIDLRESVRIFHRREAENDPPDDIIKAPSQAHVDQTRTSSKAILAELEIPKGTILEVRGLREGTTKAGVQHALSSFGTICFLEVLRIPPGAREGYELHTSEEEADDTGRQQASLQSGEPSSLETSSRRIRGPTATARCRFSQAEEAHRAAEELNDIEGAAVCGLVLSGSAEVAYLHRITRCRRRCKDGPAAALAVAHERRNFVPLTSLKAWRKESRCMARNANRHKKRVAASLSAGAEK